MFVGVGASRVRELFKTARQNAPSIIFIDEIDSVTGQRRLTDSSHSRDTVNQILAEMDGFKPSDNVIVIGATNFSKVLLYIYYVYINYKYKYFIIYFIVIVNRQSTPQSKDLADSIK